MFTDDKFIIPKTITGDNQLMESSNVGIDEINRKSEVGWMDVADSSTSSTPLSVPATTWTVIPNDTLSSKTQSGYLPYGVTDDIWDATNNRFKWDDGGLSLGDLVEIRFSAEVTTSTSNQTVIVELFMAQGSGIDYEILFNEITYKTSGSHRLNRFNGIYIGNTGTLNYPAQFKIYSDYSCTAVIDGFYVKVTKIASNYS